MACHCVCRPGGTKLLAIYIRDVHRHRNAVTNAFRHGAKFLEPCECTSGVRQFRPFLSGLQLHGHASDAQPVGRIANQRDVDVRGNGMRIISILLQRIQQTGDKAVRDRRAQQSNRIRCTAVAQRLEFVGHQGATAIATRYGAPVGNVLQGFHVSYRIFNSG